MYLVSITAAVFVIRGEDFLEAASGVLRSVMDKLASIPEPQVCGRLFSKINREYICVSIFKKGANMMANFFTKFLADIFYFAVIFRLVLSENKTTYELICTMSIMHNQ